jgi:RNA polymerase sigma factor (sigma-70 family)
VSLRANSDEELLAGRDAASFELFYCHQVDRVLGYFARRTREPELAADLTAETFAAALAGRRRYRPEAGPAAGWLFGIASKKLADAQRKGYAERRARRRMGMERLEPTDDDLLRIERLAEREVTALVDVLPREQRDAVRAHVIEERGYEELAHDLHTSEAVVRKRVSRGLAVLRDKMGHRQ